MDNNLTEMEERRLKKRWKTNKTLILNSAGLLRQKAAVFIKYVYNQQWR